MEQKTLSVHLCGGCEIGSSIDLEALAQIPEGAECSTHPCLCSDEGIASLKSAIKNGANALVIAACSPRYKTEEFTFDKCFVERVNLREQVAWSHEPNDEDTQMMAEDYLRMGLVRAQKAELPEPFEIPIDKTILVVGAGTAGIEAATQAARAGYEVILVEKNPDLGGWRRKFSRVFPDKAPYGELTETNLNEQVADIEQDERITLHTSSVVAGISGQPGQFDVDIRTNGDVKRVRVGAIVQATGWEPYDANKLTHLGYTDSADIVTNVEMEEMLAQNKLKRPSDGKPIKTVAFVQCAGSRDKEHLAYCSTVCCRVTMKQALRARELHSDLQAVVLYKDIRTPGQYEDLYRKAQDDGGILFTKGDVQSVANGTNGSLSIDVRDTLLGEQIRLDADLVVLATGMVPVSADGEANRRYQDAQAVIERGDTGAKLVAAQKTVAELEPYVSESILNLDYRQGLDTPVLKHSFPDSHFICFPFETRRTGIYHAGAMRAPSDTASSRSDGAGAALKAIQTVELAAQGKAVHPRWEDMSYPDFFFQRCTQCKRCTEECPFGVLNEDEKGTPQPNPTRCRRCGICLGACPERVISFKDYSIDIVSSMIKSVEIPDEFDEKPRLLGFVCENDAYPALDTAGLKRLKHSAYIRFIPVRCLGSVNIVWIA
ncbi:MAG TPA: FAD-dependent oxidoreductase, partial [Acidobacteriota bacterium]|nr:FAD-dependent oxidoreductase [Acidobacteriota bacterium]